MDAYNVIFAPRAEADLRSITFHIARRAGAVIAERFGDQLINKALSLSTLLERGRVVPEHLDPQLREIIYKTYRIVYRIRHHQVQVVRFWHAARGKPEIDSDEFSASKP